MSDKLFTVSIKGSSQSQAWVVVNADSAQELLDALTDLADQGLYQAVADANALYQGVANVSNPSGRAPAPAGSGEQAQETQAATTAPARQRGSSNGGSSYGRRKASAGTGGRGGQKPRLSYEEASADCVHGQRVRRSGSSAKGDWVGYFCPTPKGTADQCSPNFLDPADDQEG